MKMFKHSEAKEMELAQSREESKFMRKNFSSQESKIKKFFKYLWSTYKANLDIFLLSYVLCIIYCACTTYFVAYIPPGKNFSHIFLTMSMSSIISATIFGFIWLRVLPKR